MIWDNPQILFALLFLPFIALLFVFEWRARSARCAAYAAPALFEKLSTRRRRSGILSRIALSLAFAFFVIALAGPRWGIVSRKVEERSSSVMIALDVSASMFCEDIKPTRFKASIAKIKHLLSILSSERYGLVGFAGRAFVICPLTGDITSLRMLLDELSAGEIPYPGTNIADALSKSAESFADDANSKAVILLTDGENLQGNPSSIVRELKDIKVFAIGVGTPEGEPIPIKDDSGRVTGYRKDDKGETVISRRDETLLLQIANATGGRYFPFDPANRDIEQIADAINSMGKDSMGESFSASLDKKFTIPLAAALFFMFVDFLLPFTTRKKTFLDKLPPALMLFFLLVAPGSADDISRGNRAFRNEDFFKAEQHYRDALRKDAAEDAYYNLANTYHAMEKYDEAEKNYTKAAAFDNPRMEENLAYNMANNFYRKGDVAAAIGLYRRGLMKNPASSDALHNLELALRHKSEDGDGDGSEDGGDDEQEGGMSEDELQRMMNLLEDMEKSSRKPQEQQPMPAVSQDW